MLLEYMLIAALNGKWFVKETFMVEKGKGIETCYKKAIEYNLTIFRCVRTKNERQ